MKYFVFINKSDMNIFMFQCIWWYTFAMVLIDGCVHDEIKSKDDEYIIVHG